MANLDLSKYGIKDVKEIIHNPSYDVLFAEETKPGLEGFEKGQVTELGAVNVMTGIYTGRSPKDKFFVMNEASKDSVWWTSEEYKNDNKPCSEEAWADLKAKAVNQLSGKPENASGSVVACAMEGTRPMLMEIQALICRSNFGMPRRTAAGLDYNRVNLLMAVLEKRMGLPLSNYDAYVNIAGGIRMNEPAADLGIVMAIASSYKNKPIAEDTIVFGDVGLSGEVRAVTMPEQRVAEAKKLGFKTCIVPAVALKSIGKVDGIEVIGVNSVNQAMNYI